MNTRELLVLSRAILWLLVLCKVTGLTKGEANRRLQTSSKPFELSNSVVVRVKCCELQHRNCHF